MFLSQQYSNSKLLCNRSAERKLIIFLLYWGKFQKLRYWWMWLLATCNPKTYLQCPLFFLSHIFFFPFPLRGYLSSCPGLIPIHQVSSLPGPLRCLNSLPPSGFCRGSLNNKVNSVKMLKYLQFCISKGKKISPSWTPSPLL